MKAVRIALCFCMILCFSCYTAAAQEEEKIQTDKSTHSHKTIRIQYSGAVIPKTLTVQPGTTVIWINESKRPVEILFEGKQVTLACKSPVHFIVTEDGTFMSDKIPYGAVASLCFIEKGEFSYKARVLESAAADWHTSRERSKIFEGKIIVAAGK